MRGIEIGTAVVPSYPRHSVFMAQHALTVQAVTSGRFVLGLGVSQRVVLEPMFGVSHDRPARHMREYLSILMPLVHGQPVSFKGETMAAEANLAAAGTTDFVATELAIDEEVAARTRQFRKGRLQASPECPAVTPRR